MDPRIEAALDEWRFRACDPGYAGLNALADAEFTGAVRAEGAIGFMVNGRLVGLTGGSIESYWGAEITALEADGPALPLLCAMLSTDHQEEGEYYTGETPISEVDETLTSGGFTGYIDLSENVFSGDYFVVYYGGRSLAAAFLGTEDRIVTGEEARQRASDEVGIFTVNSVDIDVIELPDADVDDSASAREPEPEPEPEPTPDAASSPSEAEASVPDPAPPSPDPGQAEQTERVEPAASGPPEIVRLAEAALDADPATLGQDGATSGASVATNELVTIPALDPARTEETAPAEPESPSPQPAHDESTATQPEEPDEPPTEEVDPAIKEELEEALAENERLKARIEELEVKLEELRAEEATGSSMTPTEALSGTNLFVRYASTSNFTIEDALEGNASREEVRDNIRLEWHTTFETEELTVDEEPYEAFLQNSIRYQFSEWVLAELLFDLVDAGEAKGFSALLEVIPEVDRIEFTGEVPVHSKQGDDRQSHTYAFDLVFRNSMGDPVLVADVHSGREPVGGEPVETLLSESNTIASNRNSLAGAFFVSKSYFEPPALETIAEATSGGLLRGGSKQSYVSVSRKQGFHLCLVEARNGSFHLSIPEN